MTSTGDGAAPAFELPRDLRLRPLEPGDRSRVLGVVDAWWGRPGEDAAGRAEYRFQGGPAQGVGRGGTEVRAAGAARRDPLGGALVERGPLALKHEDDLWQAAGGGDVWPWLPLDGGRSRAA